MRRSVLLVAIVAIVGLAGAVAFLIGLSGDHTLVRLLAKPVPVLAMTVLAMTVLAMTAMTAAAASRQAYGRLIAAGLLACALGDVLLELGDHTFLAGVGAFLVGHLFYTAAFLLHTRAARPWLALPMVIWGASLLLFLRPGLAEHGMTLPVAVYAAVICTMLWRAAARWQPGSPIDPGVLAALIGALLFVASDSLIALNRFHFGGAHAAPSAMRYWIIMLYWLGQLGITASVLHAGRWHDGLEEPPPDRSRPGAA